MLPEFNKLSTAETATFVSQYLLDNPDFFRRHPDVFTHMSLPRQNREGTRSIIECQNEVLRATLTTYEMREEELNARERQLLPKYVLQDLLTLSNKLLATEDLSDFPGLVLAFFKNFFNVPHGTVRLWDVKSDFAFLPFARPIGNELEASIDSMGSAYWGPNTGNQIAEWLLVDPQETSWTFLLPLRGSRNKAFGMICVACGHPCSKKHEDVDAFVRASYPIAQTALYRLTNRNL